MTACSHMDQIRDVEKVSEGCAKCIEMGDSWVHLRMCKTCGHVGCCDNSKNKHGTAHYHETDHPIIQSVEPGESWMWCFADGRQVSLPEPPPPDDPAPTDSGSGDESPPTSGTSPDSIIRRYLLLAGPYTLSASVIWGVNTLFLLDAGLSILEVFIANATFTGSMALFEIPTGVLADTRGRRASFLLPGIKMFWVGCHHRGSMAVSIQTAKGKVVISDALFTYENFDPGIPIGVLENIFECEDALQRVPEEADLVIPNHDNKVLVRYPDGIIA